MNTQQSVEAAVEAYSHKHFDFGLFQNGVRDFFLHNPSLKGSVHSVKSRQKDPEHLAAKILKKNYETTITPDNIFTIITDLAGVRVLHLYQDQFSAINAAIRARIDSDDWVLHEKPIAYTWDPESVKFFEQFDLLVERKESFYTSIHYVVRPRKDSPLCCEIQVRTLFEEIWGEIDHRLNYPETCSVAACREQILVLSKLVGAGSRLADSIFRTAESSRAEYPA